MDQTLKTLNHTHQNFNPPIESGDCAVNFWSQSLTCHQQFANVSHVEYPSFKKPRTSGLINEPTTGIPLRTELCLQFKKGHCTFGDTCRFVHGIGIGGTRKPVPHRQELMARETNVIKNGNEDHRIISAMKLCRRFCNREVCPYGERCHFLHEAPGKFRKSFAVSIGTSGPGGFSRNGCDQLEYKPSVHSSLDANGVAQKPVFWKTKICKKWEATGNCPFGVNCCFAHGHTVATFWTTIQSPHGNSKLQKSGSQAQAAMESGNVSPSKMIPTTATHTSLSSTRNGIACEQQMQVKKRLFKWKGFEKMSRIYADWIDDMPLKHSSLSKVGS
ncbi:unnamed protein product [Camellia sinensis]